ncbi:phosphoribosylamine--glycine ligase [Roseococcus microcysteis]|uniref:phosphoribosylamine--glycine ligase n=1 Tax=Roseococcus microcysteis TaxID=2771361 RepID=UPI00168B9666|nr:phosphoribosylamine--glycine ligase [Roseococcus microcysteis]
MRHAPFLMLFVLAACAQPNEPLRGGAPMTNAECRAEAEATPAVRNWGAQAGPAAYGPSPRAEAARQEALSQAYRDCLRRRNLPAPGGVERLRP